MQRILQLDSSDDLLIALAALEQGDRVDDAGDSTIEAMGERVLDLVIAVANGEFRTKAELKSQEDFIPWKRGVSL